MKVLVFEIGNPFSSFRTLESCDFGLRTTTRCYGLGKAAKALSVQGLLLLRLLPSIKIIDYAVELSAHLSGVLILVFIFFLINMILLFGELLTLIVLEVISGVLGLAFLLLVLILFIEGHLVDLII